MPLPSADQGEKRGGAASSAEADYESMGAASPVEADSEDKGAAGSGEADAEDEGAASSAEADAEGMGAARVNGPEFGDVADERKTAAGSDGAGGKQEGAVGSESTSAAGSEDTGAASAEDAIAAGSEGSDRPSLNQGVSQGVAWAKEGFSAMKERQEAKNLAEQLRAEISDHQATRERLAMELSRRQDILGRYDSILQEQGRIVDDAQTEIGRLNASMASTLEKLQVARGKLEELQAIQGRLLKPFEEQYEAMKAKVDGMQDLIDVVQSKVDAAQGALKSLEDQMSSDRERLVGYEAELDKLSSKNMSASEKLKAGNVIAGEMAAIQIRLEPMRDEMEDLKSQIDKAQGELSALQSQLEPLNHEFEAVKRDLREQRESFQKQQGPLRKEVDDIVASVDGVNQAISDQEELVRAATEELDVAQDVHDHPERLEELREGMAAEDEEIARLQERLNSAKSHADSLRDTDLRGKLLVAAFVLLALIVIMLALAL